MRDVSAVILAGGLGTRARAISEHTPKVLLEVAGRPFLGHLLDFVQRAGIEQAVLCTGYKADLVEKTLGTRWGRLRLRYSREEVPLGTGGALSLACRQVDTPRIVAFNGDSYCACDLASLVRAQSERRGTGTLAVVEVPDCARYGRVEFQPDGRITRFAEKTAVSGAGWINAGIYALDTDWLRPLPADKPCSLERDVFPEWLGRGLCAHRCTGPFLDIGTPESFAQAEGFFAALTATAAGEACA